MRIKKILSIFLATALLLSTLTISVSAEEKEVFRVEVEAETTTSTLSSTPIIYNPGDEITVKVGACQNTGITSVMLYIDYDETALEVVENKFKTTNLFTAHDSISKGVTSKGDEYFVFYSDNYPNVSSATGVFAEITFIAKDVCKVDTAVTVTTFQNSSGNCTVNTLSGMKEVPFESSSDVFSIHNIDKTTGVVTDPTCTEIGYTTYDCPGCEEKVVGNLVDAKGHTEAEPVIENRVEPTCTVEGSYDSVVYCEVCDVELSREGHVVDALGHDLKNHEAKAPTCTEIGWDAYDTCTRCDYTTYVEKAALDHDLVHHEAKAPTCTEIGWDAYDTCTRCDYTTYVEKAALGHTYGETTIVEPEYKVDGYSTHTCTVCNHEEKFDIVPALTYILGDVDGNEEITDADAEYLLMHTFFAEEYPVNQTCDFNDDGQVNDADAEYLLMYTFFPEDYPLS